MKTLRLNNQLPLIVAVAFLVSAAISARGAGFDLPDQDAFVIARGMAFVATADNPSAIYYNPAGITQLPGNNLRGGIYGIYLLPSYTPPGGGRSFDNQDTLHALPQLYYTHGQEDCPVSLGLGLYSPFGLGLRWPQDTGFRTVGTRSQLTCITLNPVAALKLAEAFSIGGGITVNYADATLEQGLFSMNQDTDLFRFRGNGWSVGYNLGARWQPYEKIAFGVSFRSGTRIDLHGHTEAQNSSPPAPIFSERTAANADFPFPLKAIFGVSYRPTPQWNLEFDADYTDWSSVNTVTIHQPSSVVLPKNVALVLGWQSSWYYEFGATRYLDNGWHVSAGYILNENSDPNAHYTPLSADLERHFFSIGTGFQGKRFDVDIAYQFGYGPSHTVSGSAPSPAGQTADGRYDFISHAIAVSTQMHF
jgi:long-chain fatty acid transport protein